MPKHRRWRGRKKAIVIALAGVLVTAAAFWIGTRTDGKDTCDHAIVTRAVSPDGAWEAVVDEATCGVGWFAMDVTAGVRLISGTDPARTSDVLGVDTGGNADERPHLAWIAPNLTKGHCS